MSDHVTVTGGTLTLNNQSFSDFTFSLTSGFTGSGTYDLFSTDGSGDLLGALLTATGTIDGDLATISVVNSQNLILTINSAPEPSTWILFLCSFSMLVFWRLSQRRT